MTSIKSDSLKIKFLEDPQTPSEKENKVETTIVIRDLNELEDLENSLNPARNDDESSSCHDYEEIMNPTINKRKLDDTDERSAKRPRYRYHREFDDSIKTAESHELTTEPPFSEELITFVPKDLDYYLSLKPKPNRSGYLQRRLSLIPEPNQRQYVVSELNKPTDNQNDVFVI